ncbi:MAG: sigma-54 interaction domain-containing protein [Nitrospinales bacterium]
MAKKLKIETDPRLAQFTIERAADAILWHDSAARIKRANQAACDQLGYTREELLSRTIQDINPNSTKQTWAKFWKKLRKKKVVAFEDEHRAKDGRVFPVEVRVNFIEFEGREYAVGFNRDISERKKNEEEKACAYREIDRLRRKLELENEYLQEEVLELQTFGSIVGQSQALQHILRQVEMVAPTVANVLITGESGTGKELIAHEIHKRSQRSQRSMIRVNCASIPRELYESEFFGHVKGAFTGAIKNRAGRFELADGGVLFLDEVGEIPFDLQSKLLRVLQEGTFERVGDEKTYNVDVRVIAATNRNLVKEVEQGKFREDLYYRLNVFPIEIAPLRKRKEDIPTLANHFLNLALRKFNFPGIKLTKGNLINLQNYDWPGNARELQNVIERAVIISKLGKLIFDLPKANAAKGASSSRAKTHKIEEEGKVVTFDEIKQLERENILKALEKTNWKIFGEDGAAELLGTRPTTLTSRLQRMGLKKPG